MGKSPCAGEAACIVCGGTQYGWFDGARLCHVHYLKARMDAQWNYISELQQRVRELEAELDRRPT